MNSLTTLLLILLLVDSIWVIYAAAKKKWVMVAVCFAIGAVLDILLLHNA
ncbi:MAG: hypothetical protein SFX19_05255 [Alphaproteobacteria bacterium]|nr:hypothetical protein [Alphaproteobacteria bacterium]